MIGLSLASWVGCSATPSVPTLPPPGGTLAELSDRVVGALLHGSADAVRDLLGGSVTVDFSPGDEPRHAVDSQLSGTNATATWIESAADVARKAHTAMNGFNASDSITCTATCCTYDYPEGVEHFFLYVTRVCFENVDGRRSLASIEGFDSQ